jgi:hypothetical protein
MSGMGQDTQPSSERRQLLIFFWLAAYVAWYWIAQDVAEARGRSGEAWSLSRWLLFTTIGGCLFGGWALMQPNRRAPIVLFAAATAVHAAVGLGMHPR